MGYFDVFFPIMLNEAVIGGLARERELATASSSMRVTTFLLRLLN